MSHSPKKHPVPKKRKFDERRAMFEEHRASHYTAETMRRISECGLNAVRLPLGYWILQEPGQPATAGLVSWQAAAWWYVCWPWFFPTFFFDKPIEVNHKAMTSQMELGFFSMIFWEMIQLQNESLSNSFPPKPVISVGPGWSRRHRSTSLVAR